MGFLSACVRPCGAGIVEADIMTHLKQGLSAMRGLCQVDLILIQPQTGRRAHCPPPGKTLPLYGGGCRERSYRGSTMKFKWFLPAGDFPCEAVDTWALPRRGPGMSLPELPAAPVPWSCWHGCLLPISAFLALEQAALGFLRCQGSEGGKFRLFCPKPNLSLRFSELAS